MHRITARPKWIWIILKKKVSQIERPLFNFWPIGCSWCWEKEVPRPGRQSMNASRRRKLQCVELGVLCQRCHVICIGNSVNYEWSLQCYTWVSESNHFCVTVFDYLFLLRTAHVVNYTIRSSPAPTATNILFILLNLHEAVYHLIQDYWTKFTPKNKQTKQITCH